ncbi:MAG: DUF2889 domain-containing protein [Rhodospirillaceae bacterium]
MPLPEPSEREPIQTREISVAAFRRTDGNWDIEGHLIDVADYDISNFYRGTIQAGSPIHDMRIRITLNAELEIVDIIADMDAHPYSVCPGVLPSFHLLKGEKIGPGWNRKLRELLGGVNGCVHLVDLLRPVGTIGFKTVRREAGKDDVAKEKRQDYSPYQINTCHALSSSGEIVKSRWPDLYTGN